jgi:hypothetical protein
MPCKLIKKLKTFSAMSLSLSNMSHTTVLNSLDMTALSDDVMDLVDDISDTALALFGPNREPSMQQYRVLNANNFQIQPGTIDASGWKVGHIQTPHGIIAY